MLGTKNNYFQSLYQLATKLDSTHSPEDVAYSIVSSVAKGLNSRACSLMLLTPDRKELLHTSAYGLSDWFIRKGPVLFDKSISQTLEGSPVMILDAATDERIIYRNQVKKEGIASILSVPVKLKGNVIGVMRIYSSEPRRFDDEDISFSCSAANFGAIALEKCKSCEALQREYDLFRQEMIQWRAELGSEGNVEETLPFKERGPMIPPGG